MERILLALSEINLWFQTFHFFDFLNLNASSIESRLTSIAIYFCYYFEIKTRFNLWFI